MNRFLTALSVVSLAPLLLTAQPAPRRPFVRAMGEASVSARPDMAKVAVAVQNQAATAEQAAAENATRSTAVFDKLRALLGKQAELRTLNYSLTPNYVYPREGGTPKLNGFIANNSIEATVTDLSLIGRIIDTAVGAGATRIDGIQLMLKEEAAARTQALRMAGQKARAEAEAIASGLNARIGAVISAEETANYRVPMMAQDRMMAREAAMPTPVEPGTLEIRASVTVEFELVP